MGQRLQMRVGYIVVLDACKKLREKNVDVLKGTMYPTKRPVNTINGHWPSDHI